MQIIWWILLGGSMLLYIMLAELVIPTALFRPRYGILTPSDRGLKNFKEKNGRSIAFETAAVYREFIEQYILSSRNQKKVILCKIKQDIFFLDYDIVLFNSRDRAFRVINVKDNIEKAGFTRMVELPQKTAYATLLINSVNGKKILSGGKTPPIGRRIALFSVLVCLLTVSEIFFAKYCIGEIFGDVFVWDFMEVFLNNLLMTGIGILAAALNVTLVSLFFVLRARREAR